MLPIVPLYWYTYHPNQQWFVLLDVILTDKASSIALAQLWLFSVVPDCLANKYVTLDCSFWQLGKHRDFSADFSHARYADVRTTYIFIGSTIYTVKVYLWLLETNFSDSFYQNTVLFIQRNSDENVLRWRHPLRIKVWRISLNIKDPFTNSN